MVQYIIVIGMAHSGTTILTRTLSQHPEIDLFKGGGEDWLYENDALLDENPDRIFAYGQKSKKEFILMKRPWVHHKKAFLVKNFLDAHYLYIQRTKKEIFSSWDKPTSMVEEEAKNNINYQNRKYDESEQYSIELENSVKNFTRIQHEELCKNPELIFNNIVQKIGLNDFKFNVREIQEKIDIKSKLRYSTNRSFPPNYKYMI